MGTGRDPAWRTGPGRRAGHGGRGQTGGRGQAGAGGRADRRRGCGTPPQAPSALPVTGGRGLAAQSWKLLFRRLNRPLCLPTETIGPAAGQNTCFQRPSLPNPGSVPSGPEHLSTPTLAVLPAQLTVNPRPTPLTRQEGRACGQRSGDSAKGSASILEPQFPHLCRGTKEHPPPPQGCAGLRSLGAEWGPTSLPAPGAWTPPSCCPLSGPGPRPARA